MLMRYLFYHNTRKIQRYSNHFTAFVNGGGRFTLRSALRESQAVDRL